MAWKNFAARLTVVVVALNEMHYSIPEHNMYVSSTASGELYGLSCVALARMNTSDELTLSWSSFPWLQRYHVFVEGPSI